MVSEMRWIDARAFRPSAGWLEKAAEKTDALREMSEEERRRALRASSASTFWGLLRDDLSTLGHGKCWYTEAHFGGGDAQVEHYRPKLGWHTDGDQPHDGYWWLAFDYRNYRLIASIPNRTKSSAFPIDGPRVVDEGGVLDDELPVLLDPTKPHDASLLTFADGGTPRPAPHATAIERHRVEYTVQRCGLSAGHVARERETVWNDCTNALREWALIRASAGNSPSARERANALAERVAEMVKPETPYSRAAKACASQQQAAAALSAL